MSLPQVQDPSELSTLIFRLLIGRRLADKYKAIEKLSDASAKLDRSALRSSILKAIRNDFFPGKEDADNDRSIADTRSWLLNALGRLSSDDDDTTREIASHINMETEPNAWARYWALEGLIVGGNKKIEEIARTAARTTWIR